MKIYTSIKETGDFIEEFENYYDAAYAIKKYEAEDEKNGDYTPEFYDIVDEEHCSVYNPIHELRRKTNLSVARFSKKYGIPERTIQDWESEKRKPASYLIELLKFKIENDTDEN